MCLRRVLPIAVTTMLVLAACGAGVGDDTEAAAERSDVESFEVEQIPSDPAEVEISALTDPEAEGLPDPLVDVDLIRSGGPPPDGIPPIDEPRFTAIADVDFLEDEEAVLALEIDGEARAYPIQIMMWHEIVNDTVGGIPVTVSFCPLCNSALAYDRRVDDRILDFGTSGSLYNSALVMYDRQTESLWSHFTAEAIVGTLTGSTLDTFPVATVSWDDFRNAHPDGIVLSRDTGHERAYGQNPYVGYDDPDDVPFLFEGEVDGRLAVKERIVGIRDGDLGVAVRLSELEAARVMEVTVGERDLVAWVKPGTASSLDAVSVAGGRDVGATGVFFPSVDGQHLTFESDGEGFRDRETGSRWDVLGQATDGPLAGSSLEGYPHVDTFWFAWVAFLPDTAVVPPLSDGT
jgi:hypothetical protein